MLTDAELAVEMKPIVESYEGCKNEVYLDHKGNPTVGIGVNLNRPGAKGALAAVGADYDQIREGKARLTDKQVEQLFVKDFTNSIIGARNLIRGYDTLPDKVRGIAADMVFNMGVGKFKGFVQTRRALSKHDFKRAYKEMQDSRWGVKTNRSRQYIPAVKKLVDSCADTGICADELKWKPASKRG